MIKLTCRCQSSAPLQETRPWRSILSCALRPLRLGLFISAACARHCSTTPLRGKRVADGFSASRTRTLYAHHIHDNPVLLITVGIHSHEPCRNLSRGYSTASRGQGLTMTLVGSAWPLPRQAEMTVIRHLKDRVGLALMDRTSRYMRLHASLLRSNNMSLVGEIGLVSSLLKKVA